MKWNNNFAKNHNVMRRIVLFILLTTLSTQINAQNLLAQAKPAGSKEWGYISTSGEFVIPVQYRDCHPFSEGLAPIYDKKGKTFYFIKSDGSTLITEAKSFRLRNIFGFGTQGFEDGMVPVEINKAWGYMNSDGKMAVSAKFDKAQEFNGGFGVAEKSGRFYIISKDGTEKQVDAAGLEDVRKFSEGLAPFRSNGYWGFLNTNGEIVMKAKYKAVGYMSDGLAWVKDDEGKIGFVNANGDVKIGFEFEAAKDFTNGIARVKKGDTWTYVKTDGTMLNPPAADTYGKFSEGLAYFKTEGKVGFIDKNGKPVIDQLFDAVRDFKNGYAAVKQNDKWGVIDRSGNWVIEPKFDGLKDFEQTN